MPNFDLTAFSLKELKDLQKDIDRAIANFETRQKAEARAELEALAKERGFSLAELVSSETKKTRVPAQPKYRHPENPALTWSGRGRKPLWFVDYLAAGKSPENLMIG